MLAHLSYGNETGAGLIIHSVGRQFQSGGPEQGSVYRDIDGQLVRVVKVSKYLCTWVPISHSEQTRQATHRDNFVRRFTPLNRSSEKLAA